MQVTESFFGEATEFSKIWKQELIHQNFIVVTFPGNFPLECVQCSRLKVEMRQPLLCQIGILDQGLEHTDAPQLVLPMADLE